MYDVQPKFALCFFYYYCVSFSDLWEKTTNNKLVDNVLLCTVHSSNVHMLLNVDFLQYTYFHNADKIDWILIFGMRKNAIIKLKKISIYWTNRKCFFGPERFNFFHRNKFSFSDTIRIKNSRLLFIFCLNVISYRSHYLQSISNSFFFEKKNCIKIHYFVCKSPIAHNTINKIVFSSSIFCHMQNIYSDDDFSPTVRWITDETTYLFSSFFFSTLLLLLFRNFIFVILVVCYCCSSASQISLSLAYNTIPYNTILIHVIRAKCQCVSWVSLMFDGQMQINS